MDTQKPIQIPHRYVMPTHLNVPDTIVFPLFGFSLALTLRQATILVLGWIGAYEVFQANAALPGMARMVLHLIIPVLIVCLIPLLAFVTIAERSLETWLIVLYLYRIQPRIYLWRRLNVQERTLEHRTADEFHHPISAADHHDTNTDEEEV